MHIPFPLAYSRCGPALDHSAWAAQSELSAKGDERFGGSPEVSEKDPSDGDRGRSTTEGRTSPGETDQSSPAIWIRRKCRRVIWILGRRSGPGAPMAPREGEASSPSRRHDRAGELLSHRAAT